jgi:hypothetical protein
VRAFRAGNYGADFGTLKALQANGIRLDSSYARPHLGRPCALHIEAPLAQPAWVDGVLEFPLGYFEDWPGHYRIEPDDVRPVGDQTPLRSHPLRTAWRYVEQAQGRLRAWRLPRA